MLEIEILENSQSVGYFDNCQPESPLPINEGQQELTDHNIAKNQSYYWNLTYNQFSFHAYLQYYYFMQSHIIPFQRENV
ncbi:hypothetical protein UY3_05472 [Chelonia mydas]|uniref:Uncharacterized protein n=1 Tax=Chelonia mydas TaxID=8469 RepID=M7C9Q1_CHEMY|nr:hypothetical protein UY3_05472 [Chelonia mydas]